jgi:outer membrane biosynthesis protein TonB
MFRWSLWWRLLTSSSALRSSWKRADPTARSSSGSVSEWVIHAHTSAYVCRLIVWQILTSEQPADWAIDTVEDLTTEEKDEGSSVDPKPGDIVAEPPKPAQPAPEKPKPEPAATKPEPQPSPKPTNDSNGNFSTPATPPMEEEEVFTKQEPDRNQIQTGLRQRGLTQR